MAGEPLLAAERSILAAMLLGADGLSEGATLVRREDFSRASHGLVHAALCALLARGEPADIVTLAAELEARGDLGAVGGPQAIAGLMSNATTTANLRSHATLVRESARHRAVRRDALLVADAIERGDHAGAEALVASMADRISTVSSSTHVGDGIQALFSGGILPHLPLPLSCLDNLRIRPGSLTTFAARPGAGKSAMLTTLTLSAARAGWSVCFITLEMPSLEVRQRMLAEDSGLPLSEVTNPGARTHELIASANRVSALPIWLDDLSGRSLDLERIVREAAGFASAHEKPVLVLDYLQLVHTRERHEKRHEAIGHVCRELKRLALRCRMPVVTAAQLGRAVEQRGKDSRPQLSDLRESGDIENTCDNVVLMHPENEQGVIGLKVAKQRMGPKFRCEALFIPESCTFTDRPQF